MTPRSSQATRPALASGLLLAAALLLTPTPSLSASPQRTPAEHRRPPDQTYLTFPEWFLVHSPNEFATYTAQHSPSGFPFLTHVAQLWSSYAAVTRATAEFDLNVGYHAMILVIGTSTTVEYGIRAGYETLVGRLAEATQGHGPTAEERFGARVAQEYVDFINVRPWYEFDFTHALARLWTEVPLTGHDLIRKLERRYMLTTEYAAKAGYAWLIGAGTAASYEPAGDTTAIVIDAPPRVRPEGLELTVLRALPDGSTLATLPRYEAFGRHATRLANAGVEFEEIAGNSTGILISVLAPSGWSERRGDVLFVQPIPTRRGEERGVLEVTVGELAEALRAIDRADHVRLEHVYDF